MPKEEPSVSPAEYQPVSSIGFHAIRSWRECAFWGTVVGGETQIAHARQPYRTCLILQLGQKGWTGLVYFHDAKYFSKCTADEVFADKQFVTMHLPVETYADIVRLLNTPGVVHMGHDGQGTKRTWLAGMPVARESKKRKRG